MEQTVDMFEGLYGEKYGEDSAYREAGIDLVSFPFRGVGIVSKHEFRVEDVGGDGAALVGRVRRGWTRRASSRSSRATT